MIIGMRAQPLEKGRRYLVAEVPNTLSRGVTPFEAAFGKVTSDLEHRRGRWSGATTYRVSIKHHAHLATFNKAYVKRIPALIGGEQTLGRWESSCSFMTTLLNDLRNAERSKDPECRKVSISCTGRAFDLAGKRGVECPPHEMKAYNISTAEALMGDICVNAGILG